MTNDRKLLAPSILLLGVHVYLNMKVVFPCLPFPLPALSSSVVVLMGFSVLHSIYVFGNRKTWMFFGLTAVASWLLEEIGVATGLIYGNYHYSDQLGTKLGHVPVLIPIAWFMMIYPSHSIARIIIDGDINRPFRGIRRVFGTSFIASMVMTAWDVVMDPPMAKRGVWIWDQGGSYFGVPLHNFVGWMVTCFIVYSGYGLFESFDKSSNFEMRHPTRLTKSLPLIAYTAYATRYVFHPDIPELSVVAFFSMGFPVVFAWNRILRQPLHEDPSSERSEKALI